MQLHVTGRATFAQLLAKLNPTIQGDLDFLETQILLYGLAGST